LQRTMDGESGCVARGSVGGASVLSAIILSAMSSLPLLPGLSVRWVLRVPRAQVSLDRVRGVFRWPGWREAGLSMPSFAPRLASPAVPSTCGAASRSPSQLPAGTVPERCGARRTYCTATLPSSGGDAGPAGRRVGASGGERRAQGPASTSAEISVLAPLPSPRPPFSSPPARFAPGLRSRTSLRPLSCSLSRNPNPRVARF
jgi:hypothetical protein